MYVIFDAFLLGPEAPVGVENAVIYSVDPLRRMPLTALLMVLMLIALFYHAADYR